MTLNTKNSPLLGALAKLVSNANATAHTLAPAPARPIAPSQAVMLGISRATWYQRKNAASYRTARKAFTCAQFGCFHQVQPGEVYLDTMEKLEWPLTKRICAACAEEKV